MQPWGIGRAAWAGARGGQVPWAWAVALALRSAPKSPELKASPKKPELLCLRTVAQYSELVSLQESLLLGCSPAWVPEAHFTPN